MAGHPARRCRAAHDRAARPTRNHAGRRRALARDARGLRPAKVPVLDLRTSTFLIAVTVVVAVIGWTGACALLQRRWRRAATVGLAALAVTGFAVPGQPFARKSTIGFEDVRDQGPLRRHPSHRAPGGRDPGVHLRRLGLRLLLAHWAPLPHRPDAAVLTGYEPYYPPTAAHHHRPGPQKPRRRRRLDFSRRSPRHAPRP